MSQKTIRRIAGMIALVIVGALLMSFVADIWLTASAATTQQAVDTLRNQVSNITAQKKKVQKELNGLASEKKTLMTRKAALEREVDLTQQEIEASTTLISELGTLIAEKSVELEDAEAKLQKQTDTYLKRVRAMYENGQMGYLDVLLNAGSFSEMLSQAEIISQIIDFDQKLVGEMEKTRQAIADTKASLETDRAEEVSLKESLEENKRTLQQKIKESEDLVSQLEADEDKAKSAYEEIEAEEEKLQAELKRKIAELAANSTYVGGTMSWPLPGHTKITSEFGYRFHPTLKRNKLHTGVDISAPKGVKIQAANGGEVVTSTYSNAWGNYVVVNHGGGTATLYAHMSKRLVSVGDKVSKGDVLGEVGSTGYSTGNHLHFEIIKNGTSVDPFASEFSR